MQSQRSQKQSKASKFGAWEDESEVCTFLKGYCMSLIQHICLAGTKGGENN